MNRKLRDVLVLVAACLMLVWAIPSLGQVLKGSISGTVVDPQGAVVSGAQVKATHVSTGAGLTTKSDSAGLFRFNLIPLGSYKIEVSAQGFKTSVQNDVVVSARDTDLGSIKLSVGEASTTVEVVGAAPLIDTTQSQVTNTFAGTTLQTFAGVQENQGLDNLALFVPGVVSVRDNSFSNTNGGAGFSSNGQRGRNNDQEIDGQNNNDNSVGGPGLFVSDSEFVGQYVLVTNQFGPEYGRNSGSVVNIITKSGTNAIHGSIYEIENNSILNSLGNNQKNLQLCGPDNCLTKPPRLNNEFGGFTVGGPIVKNRAFFFGGFDQQIISTKALFTTTGLTPTPAGIATLNGCFPTSQSLQAFNKFGPYSISAGNPQPLGAVSLLTITNPVSAVSCPGVAFAGVQRSLPQPVHNFNFTLKNDLTLGNDTITSRYLFNRGNTFNLDFGDGANGYPGNVTALSQAMLISWTHNLSSHMVNEARASFGRLNVDFGGNTIGNTLPNAGGLDQALAQATIQASGFDNLFGAANNLPQQRIVSTWQAQDNWNFVLGKHALKAGVNWTYQRSPNIFLPNINGTFRFSSWGRFIANTPNRVRIANGPSQLDFREYDTFLYGGDDWKISKNLTLNLGLTWTYYGQPANLFHQITTAQQTGPNPFWNPALPTSITTDPTYPSPKNSFGPSVGFAYSPQWGGFLTGHGKTTIRGGFRMLYDPPFYNIYLNQSTSAPQVFLQTFSGTQPTSRGLPLVPTGPNVRSELAPFLTPGVFDPRTFAQTNISPNFGPDKVRSWSFGFEREVTKNSAFEARYAGNHSYNLFQTINGNPLISQLAADYPQFTTGLTPCAATTQVGAGKGTDVGRVSCGTGVLRTRNNGGYSNYAGLQLEFRANNLFKQLTVRTGYSWSKNLDNVSEIFSTFAGGNSVAIAQNPLNTTKGEYSFSGLDIPQQWTILFTEELPFFKEQHGVIGHLVGGWGLSANYVLASGQRYTPTQVFTSTFSNPGATGGSNAPGDYYDIAFWGNFFGAEPARPFLGNPSAPINAVGIFAGDACNVFGVGCTLATNQLISMNAINSTDAAILAAGNVKTVTKDQVRFIMNGFVAQKIFGTPFGNTPRNPVQDAITNIANFSVFKRFKIGESRSFEFHTTLQNAFNHQNFQSVDPILEDASDNTTPFGYGNPSLTSSVPFFYQSNNTRIIYIGGTLRF
jgi:Carboxypeptidase regulatory-like domain